MGVTWGSSTEGDAMLLLDSIRPVPIRPVLTGQVVYPLFLAGPSPAPTLAPLQGLQRALMAGAEPWARAHGCLEAAAMSSWHSQAAGGGEWAVVARGSQLCNQASSYLPSPAEDRRE
jgi:hypothetical protein